MEGRGQRKIQNERLQKGGKTETINFSRTCGSRASGLLRLVNRLVYHRACSTGLAREPKNRRMEMKRHRPVISCRTVKDSLGSGSLACRNLVFSSLPMFSVTALVHSMSHVLTLQYPSVRITQITPNNQTSTISALDECAGNQFTTHK